MNEVGDLISFTEAQVFINENIPNIKTKYSDKISRKRKLKGQEVFNANKIWLSSNFDSFKLNYYVAMEETQKFLEKFKKKNCLVKCKEVFPSFVCYDHLGNYINLKIIFHIYE